MFNYKYFINYKFPARISCSNSKQVSWFSWCFCDYIHWWYSDLLIHIIWTLKTCMNDTWTTTRNQLAMWYQEMQVSCNWSHISRSDYLLWWYQNEFCEDWSNYWLKKFMKYSWCMSIFQICEFLLTIHTTFLEDCAIFCKLDKEDYEVFMRHHVQTCIQ